MGDPFKGSAKNSALLHALAWGMLGVSLGCLLSVLQAMPTLQTYMGVLSYGRLLPVHLDSLLYGWIGLLCIHFLRGIYDINRQTQQQFNAFVNGWSFVVAISLIHIMTGLSSGRIFLEFEGWTRWLFIALLVWLSWTLITAAKCLGSQKTFGHVMTFIFKVFAYGSATLPFILMVATSPTFYPPINPDTGGPTGFDLMGSTVMTLPFLIYLPRTQSLKVITPQMDLTHKINSESNGRQTYRSRYDLVEKWVWRIWLVHVSSFLLFPHPSISHYDWRERASMLSLWIWIILLGILYSQRLWTKAQGVWVMAFLMWFSILTLTATLMFFPGILDHIKFTALLVAHAHLAMAGMCSCSMMLYCFIRESPSLQKALSLALLWNGGVALLIASFMTHSNVGKTLTTSIALQNLPLRCCAFIGMILFLGLTFQHFNRSSPTWEEENVSKLVLGNAHA